MRQRKDDWILQIPRLSMFSINHNAEWLLASPNSLLFRNDLYHLGNSIVFIVLAEVTLCVSAEVPAPASPFAMCEWPHASCRI